MRNYYVEYSGSDFCKANNDEEAIVKCSEHFYNLDMIAYTTSEWKEHIRNTIELTTAQREALKIVINDYLKYLHCNTMVDEWITNAPKLYELLKDIVK